MQSKLAIKSLCLLFVLFIGNWPIEAQVQRIDGQFVHYNLDDGLLQSRVNVITQDSTGFIWVGTREGLFRFDGNHFEKVENNNKPFINITSLVYSDQEKSLFIGSTEGVFIYDFQDDTIQNISEVNTTDLVFSENSKKLIITSIRNKIKLWTYNIRSNQLSGLVNSKQSILSLDFNEQTNCLWYTTDSLNRFCEDSDILTKFALPNQILTDKKNDVYAIIATDSIIYLGTKKLGIIEFNKKKNAYTFPNPSLSIIDIARYNHHQLLISTLSEGVGFYDIRTKNYKIIDQNINQISNSKISEGKSAFCDRQGNLWFCKSDGLYVIAKEQKMISRIASTNEKLRNRKTRFYRPQIFRDSLVFIGTNSGNGLSIFNLVLNQEMDIKWQFPKNFESITKIQNYKDQFLIAKGRKRLYKIDLDKKRITKWLELDEIIEPGVSSNFWTFSMRDNELCVFSERNVKVYSILNDFKFIESINHTLQYEDYVLNHYGNLFIDNKGGLFIYSKFNEFKEIDISQIASRKNELIDIVSYDLDTVLLCFSHTGLVLLNTENYGTRLLHEEIDFPTNRINNAAVDGNQNIWGVSSIGLVLFNTLTKRVQVYGANHGFSQTDMRLLKTATLSPHSIAIGADDGLNIVNFQEIDFLKPASPIVIYEIDGAPMKSDVVFDYEEVQHEFRFSNFDYGDFNQTKFVYSLNGGKWQPTNNKGALILTGLQSGRYTLELRAIDAFARESNITRLSFQVTTPWYQQWWFLTFVALGLLALGYFIFYLLDSRKKQGERIEQKYLQLTQELENQVLRAQMNPHFLFNSLNSIRYFILSKDSSQAAKYLSKFSRLIRMILEHSNKQVISLQDELDMVALYVDLEQLRFDHKFKYQIQISDEIHPSVIMIPPLIIQPYLENAIIHGINPKESPSLLSVDISKEDISLKIVISDDGIGRKQAAVLKKQRSIKKSSMGMGITEKRLNMISESDVASVEITDLHPDKKDSGTVVTLRMKFS